MFHLGRNLPKEFHYIWDCTKALDGAFKAYCIIQIPR